MMTKVQTISNSIIVLMKGTGTYVYNRIGDADAREAYFDTMRKCIYLVEFNTREYSDLVHSLNFEINQDIDVTYRPSFFNKKKKEIEAAKMAQSHALEIVKNLYGRFVTGICDDGLRNAKALFVLESMDVFREV